MTRIFCNSNAVSDRLRGRPGVFHPGAAPSIDSPVLSLKSTRGLVCRSPRTLWWNEFAFPMAATPVLEAHGAPLRPTITGWPSLSPSKRVYSTDGASRALRNIVTGSVVQCHVGQTESVFSSEMLIAASPGPQTGCGRGSPRRLQSYFGEWRDLRRSDVRVVAEKNGQASVATDPPPTRP